MRSGLLAVLSIGVLVSGCGAPGASAPERSAAPEPTPGSTRALPPPDPVELKESPAISEIRERGKLLVGVRSDAPKFARREQGRYVGFDVEMARIVAAELGLNPRTQVTFRRLPPTLRANAIRGGSVDIQFGGVDAGTSGVARVGPYVVTGPPGEENKLHLGVTSGDERLRGKLRDILRTAVDDGSWQRARDSTLAASGIRARPPELR
ncbi:transporter substrate-binding domain-containing protein [Halosaccharopolyspora lacisalsi]|nr:transporter substrate-binding domain-containing protein [Halosaccharopolyspora lacisalsi]